MIDKKTIIKALEQCFMDPYKDEYNTQCSDCPFWDTAPTVFECMRELKEDVITLINGQEAVEPKHYEATRYNGDLFACGDCKHELEKKPRFCPYCGKEVKWCD